MLSENPEFSDFVAELSAAIDAADGDERVILERGSKALASLVRDDSWLPAEYRVPHQDHYKQYLLHYDPANRFSVISAVWGPNQGVPPHNHTVWGLVGQLQGSELTQFFADAIDGEPLQMTGERALQPGEVIAVSPTVGDIHAVTNAHSGVSISIHAYGGDIGTIQRQIFDPKTSRATVFISSY